RLVDLHVAKDPLRALEAWIDEAERVGPVAEQWTARDQPQRVAPDADALRDVRAAAQRDRSRRGHDRERGNDGSDLPPARQRTKLAAGDEDHSGRGETQPLALAHREQQGKPQEAE